MVSGREVAGARVDIQSRATRTYVNPQATIQIFVSCSLTMPASIGANDWWVVYFPVGVNSSSLAVGIGDPSHEFVVGVGGTVSSHVVAQPGATYHLVASYDLDHGRTSLWVDPDLSDYYDPATGLNSADASVTGTLGGHSFDVVIETILHGALCDDLVIGNAPEDVGLLRSAVTGVEPPAPASAQLAPSSRPNPFRQSTTIQYSLVRAGVVRLAVFDAAGRAVRTLVHGTRPAGGNAVQWDGATDAGTAAPNGAYFYRLETAGAVRSGTLTLAR